MVKTRSTLQDLKDGFGYKRKKHSKPLAKKERYSTSKMIWSGSKVQSTVKLGNKKLLGRPKIIP